MNKIRYGAFAVAGLIALGLIGISQAKAADKETLKQMQTEMFAPAVQINSNCSATIIYSEKDVNTNEITTIALTAKHCTNVVDQHMTVQVAKYNDRNERVSETGYDAQVLGQSYKSDIALIKLKNKTDFFTAAAIAPKEDVEHLEFGQDTFNVSFPLGLTKTLTAGTLGYIESGYTEGLNSKSGDFYRSTPNIGPGSSGSGLFQNVNGKYELIGVATAQYSGFTFVNLWTPLSEIHDYLDVAKGSYEVSKEEKKDPVNK